jgi:hypothetical protein
MLEENKLIQIITEAVQARMRQAPEPDWDRVWAGIVRKARRRRAKRNLARISVLAAMVILCASFYAVINPIPVKALGNRIWYSFGTIFHGHSATIQMTYTDDLGPNHPAKLQPTNIQPQSNLTLAAAEAKCPFKLLVPDYVPAGFTLSQVKYYPENQGFAMVEIYYQSKRTGIVFTQWNVENEGTGYSYDTDDTVASDVTVRSHPGKLLYRPKDGGYSQLIWSEGPQNYQIGGAINPSEIEHIASSLHELSS